MLLYLAEGAVGLPVFAGTPERGIGIAYMMGPTGGYLVGFVLSAAITGWLTERRHDWPGTGARGHRRHDRRVHSRRALARASDRLRAEHRRTAFLPFLWGTVLKGAIAVALGMAGATMIQKRLQDQP